MSDELKPVRCGCGGEAILQFCESGYSWNRSRGFCVECTKCQIKTIDYQTQAEAIQTWNKAMGATDKNVGDKERTAKVIDKSVSRHSISDFDWTGKCEKCGNEIQFSFDYCPYCGSRLEWE